MGSGTAPRMSLASDAISSDFENLFKRWSRPVYAYAWQFTKSAYLAEETVQRVFLKLWKNLKAGKTGIPAEAQIRCISRSVIIDLLREQTRRNRIQPLVPGTETGVNATEDCFNTKELLGRIEAQVAAMPEMRRKVFTMSRFEELSHREIAERLSLSVKTVENHIAIALKTLKKTLTAFLIIFFS
ncbi:sigma-70 family RNA polymerase sigma factor [Niabella sp. CC-SYL272]|uniref:sigma-70 family RNA polymerase sigma factor n=1 Tax=Niabella agricola TaxID=2891571 RepID=UPI001F255150|nr:sigma-70 family RNA polymerase sigma factor [Niabella agricola]MCF3109456.1 sigma-70 family RNA polymerase sigma factor [Niabella agricola]